MARDAETVLYVVAVSGGVDSVALLDILVDFLAIGTAGKRLVVAHFDHGIREDSAADREFVAGLAGKYGLPFEYEEGKLGPKASEAAAREARYAFLRSVKEKHRAQRIAMAHHEDDVLETAVLNLLRGTGRKGLSSLRSTDEIYRPLLRTPKAHIIAYAKRKGLEWREDSTNANIEYLRNYIRHAILPKFDERARQRLRELIWEAQGRNVEIDGLLADQLQLQPASDRLDRQWFTMLPHAVAKEIIAAWLRRLGIATFDRKLLERIAVAAKTFAPGKRIDVNGRWVMHVGRHELVLAPRA